MDDLEDVIGNDKVLELAFSSRYGQQETELWHATLKRLDFDDDGDDEGTETVLATAELARVNLSGLARLTGCRERQPGGCGRCVL